MLITLAVIMFIIAVVFSLLGQGGGVLYTPVQVFAGVDFHVAATTSLFLIMVMSLSSTLVFRKGGKVDVPLVILLESVTAAGGLAGGLSSAKFSASSLSIGFAAFVVFAAIFMIAPISTERPPRCKKKSLVHWERHVGDNTYCVNLAVALPASFVAGLASGLLGVGGGLLKVPLMVLLLGIPMDVAVGSSAMMIGITAAGGFAGHVVHGHWDWRLSLVLAVAVFIGARVGAGFSLKINKKTLKRVFGWFLIIIAALMVIKALGYFPSPSRHDTALLQTERSKVYETYKNTRYRLPQVPGSYRSSTAGGGGTWPGV